MRPARSNGAKSSTSRLSVVPPPVDGWNAKDDLSAMKPTDAIVLDNFIPTEGGVVTRKGHVVHATGMASSIKALMEYSPPSGLSKLFAATAATVFDASASGAPGSSSLTGLGSGDWQHLMFATPGGNFLVMCNGVDTVKNYNGAAWSSPAITGVSSSNLINLASHVSRLWFIEKDSMKAWYLPALAIAGAATSIDFGPLSKLGGKLVAMASWTRDGGSGMDDVAVFFTSKGEAHVYAGEDPASAATWERIGTFRIPEPIGYRCVVKTGADVGVLTSVGLLPLSAVLPLASSGQSKVAATERIGKAFSAAYERSASVLGWQVIEGPADKLLVVNVPIAAGSVFHQYVMNSATGRWCRFKGLNANCWALFKDELYFGGAGVVYRYGGSTDLGAAIQAESISAFNNFRTDNSKTFKRIRPQFFGEAGYRPRVGLRLDYDENTLAYQAQATSPQGEAWDVAEWDVAQWAQGARPSAKWQGVRGEGFVAATIVQIASSEPLTYNGSKIIFDVGDPL